MSRPRTNGPVSRQERVTPKVIEEVREMMPCTALFHEAMGRMGNMNPSIKPLAQGTTLIGPAITVKGMPGDNLALHMALLAAGPGQVIVADCQGHAEYGYWGEFMSRVAIGKRLEGLVIDGGVRDVAPIRKLGFKVFARGVSVTGTVKKQAGTLNQTITCGGINVSWGDLILGDDDGVVAVPSFQVTKILEDARKKIANEKSDLDGILKREVPYEEFLKKKGWLTTAHSQR